MFDFHKESKFRKFIQTFDDTNDDSISLNFEDNIGKKKFIQTKN